MLLTPIHNPTFLSYNLLWPKYAATQKCRMCCKVCQFAQDGDQAQQVWPISCMKMNAGRQTYEGSSASQLMWKTSLKVESLKRVWGFSKYIEAFTLRVSEACPGKWNQWWFKGIKLRTALAKTRPQRHLQWNAWATEICRADTVNKYNGKWKVCRKRCWKAGEMTATEIGESLSLNKKPGSEIHYIL